MIAYFVSRYCCSPHVAVIFGPNIRLSGVVLTLDERTRAIGKQDITELPIRLRRDPFISQI